MVLQHGLKPKRLECFSKIYGCARTLLRSMLRSGISSRTDRKMNNHYRDQTITTNCTTSAISCERKDVTVIITTSPIPSHPSTKVLETTLESTRLLNYSFKEYIIVFDGYNLSSKEALKSGNVSSTLVSNYLEFKTNVVDLLYSIFSSTPSIMEEELEYTIRKESINISVQTLVFDDVTVKLCHVKGKAIGFAHAVNSSLCLTRTDLVLVMQHDWKFTAEIPFSQLLETFRSDSNMKYLTFSTKHKIQMLPKIDQTYSSNISRILFWYDRNHLGKTQEYLNIFKEYNFKKGYFIEDTYGQYYLNYLKESSNQGEFLARHKEIGTFIYFKDSNEICLRHMNGRRLIKDLYFRNLN